VSGDPVDRTHDPELLTFAQAADRLNVGVLTVGT
jgi:hypothetical protein